MSKVFIEVDSKWVKIAHSPLYWIVFSLQGVVVGFTPFFFYYGGKGIFPHSSWFILPLFYAVFVIVVLFYLKLGNEVIRELRKNPQAET